MVSKVPKGYIVKLPMGTGKTRIVLSHILRGVGHSTKRWNQRLERTVILAPNERVKRAWLRELLLLARYRELLGRHYGEDDIRDKGAIGLERLLKKEEISVPPFLTFRKIWGKRKPVKGGHCHYLIIDEWHSLPKTIREECREFIRDGKATKWFIGGRNVKKKIYFVSATPVNPVLEQEFDINENPYDDEVFRRRVSAAKDYAIVVIQAVLGKRDVERAGGFLEVINSMGISEIPKYGNTKLKWGMPVEANSCGKPYFREEEIRRFELHSIRGFLDESGHYSSPISKMISREYAYSVGLIRTCQEDRRGPHFVCYSKKGPKCCFGEPYQVLHYPDDVKRKRVKASIWLKDNHTRIKRLVNLLIDEGIIQRTRQDELGLNKRKALIFCTHKGVALGLVRGLNEWLSGGRDHGDGEVPVIATNVNRTNDYIERLIIGFNKGSKEPLILVLTDALSESIDLHESCKLVIHYQLPWSPLRLFQRVGRLTRLTTRGNKVEFNRNVRVAHIVIPGSVEEERINRLIRRIEFLSTEKLWPEGYNNVEIVSGLIGSGPSMHYEDYKQKHGP